MHKTCQRVQVKALRPARRVDGGRWGCRLQPQQQLGGGLQPQLQGGVALRARQTPGLRRPHHPLMGFFAQPGVEAIYLVGEGARPADGRHHQLGQTDDEQRQPEDARPERRQPQTHGSNLNR